MQLVLHELVVPCSSYNTIKSTPPTSCLKSILFVSIIPIMLLFTSTLAGLTLLPDFRTVTYATQVEIQNSNEISWYDKALAINQNNVPALVQRGTDLVNQGKYEEAIMLLDKALKIDPTNIMGLVSKGAALRELKQYNEAIVLYDRILAMDPTDVYAIGGKADSLYGLGQYELAVAWIDKALQLDPNDINVLQAKETLQQGSN